MRILWVSNAPWVQTGYGVQTALFVPRLREQGHDVWILAFYGMQGATTTWQGITVFPGGKDAYGNDLIPALARRVKADIVVTLIDSWVMNPQVTAQIRWCPLLPVDSNPVAPAVVNALQPAYQPIAYSKFGLAELKRIGMNPLYVPHAVDTAQFQPVPQGEARLKIGLPHDKFIVGLVAANKGNPSRKAFDQQIRGFADFHAEHPDSALALHTDVWGGYDGENVGRICQLAGLKPEVVHTPDFTDFFTGMLGQDYMRDFYNSADVLLNCTRGEGFGVPIIEAQACGTPAIVTDFTAMPELVAAGAGWTVDIAEKFFYMDTYQAVPSAAHITARLKEAYTIWKEQSERWQMLKQQARRGMLNNYDIDLVMDRHFVPALDQIAGRIEADSKRTEDRRLMREQARSAAGLHTHAWFETGLYGPDGLIYFPCKDCDAGLRLSADGVAQGITPGYFSMTVDGIALDIEDDPDGGVAKIVAREIVDSYRLPELSFEDGDTVVDIGAHVGVVSIWLAKKFPGIQIFAYEPIPKNFDHLQRNIRANGVNNVTAIQMAVSGDGRDLSMTGAVHLNSGGFSVVEKNDLALTVPSISFAKLFERIDRCKLLKIDCEGMEYEILESAPGVLDRIAALRGEFHQTGSFSQIERLITVCKSHIPDVLVTIQASGDRSELEPAFESEAADK